MLRIFPSGEGSDDVEIHSTVSQNVSNSLKMSHFTTWQVEFTFKVTILEFSRQKSAEKNSNI